VTGVDAVDGDSWHALAVNDDLELALRMADAADAITLSRFRATDLRVDRKPDRTPVTDADIATEDVLRTMIDAERPDDVIIGEERGGQLITSGRSWVLDPIDGTKNYSRGFAVWATLIALTQDGEPVVGVASSPALGRRWWASRGSGAWTSDAPGAVPRQLGVSGVSDLSDAYLSTTDQRVFAAQDRLAQYLQLVSSCWETRAFGDFWQHCLVAEGVLDLAVDPVANPWDLAALLPIVIEAGGAFTDLTGETRYDGGDGLSSNGGLHAAALAVIGTAT
jgi:histidinol-phosphatase